MPRYLEITNNCAIPVAAIEMLGGTDKTERDNMIGMFGTGLKYAITAAMRENIEIIITTGEHVIRFGTKNEKLANDTVCRVVMQVDDNPPAPRDWTTLLGQHDWTGAEVCWMIVREFLCNAIDEGGWKVGTCDGPRPELATTKVYIELTGGIQDVVDNLPDYCLHTGSHTVVAKTVFGEIIKNRGNRIYNKGVYVGKLPRPGIYSYNFTNLKLSESRNLEQYRLSTEFRDLVSHLPSLAMQEFLEQVRNNPDTYEGHIDPWHFATVKEGPWKQAFHSQYGEHAFVVPDNIDSMERNYLTTIQARPVEFPHSWYEILKKSGVQTYRDLLSADQKSGLDFEEPSEEMRRAFGKVRKLFPYATKFPALKVFTKGHTLVYHSDNYIAVNAASTVYKPELLMLLACMEVVTGFEYGSADFSIALAEKLLESRGC